MRRHWLLLALTSVCMAPAFTEPIQTAANISIQNESSVSITVRVADKQVTVPPHTFFRDADALSVNAPLGRTGREAKYVVQTGGQRREGVKRLVCGSYRWLFQPVPEGTQSGFFRVSVKGKTEVIFQEFYHEVVERDIEASAPARDDQNQANTVETPDEAIARVRRGAHGDFPPVQAVPAEPGENGGYTIENGTDYTLRFHISGQLRTFTIPKGQKIELRLPNGDYDVAAEVPNSRIVPFYGRQSFKAGVQYTSRFYIESRPAR